MAQSWSPPVGNNSSNGCSYLYMHFESEDTYSKTPGKEPFCKVCSRTATPEHCESRGHIKWALWSYRGGGYTKSSLPCLCSWKAHYHDEYKQDFFHNTETGVSEWIPPDWRREVLAFGLNPDAIWEVFGGLDRTYLQVRPSVVHFADPNRPPSYEVTKACWGPNCFDKMRKMLLTMLDERGSHNLRDSFGKGKGI